VARLVLGLEVAFSLAYPFAVHLGASFQRPRLAALVVLGASLALFLLGRFSRGSRSLSTGRSGPLIGAVALAGLTLWFGSSGILLHYPLIVSLALCIAFGSSLFRERSLIETFARLHRTQLEAREVSHCRAATWAWTTFFLCNGGVVAVLSIFAPLSWWTLYTGVVSYLLSAMVGLVELTIRVKRFGPDSAGVLGKRVLPLLLPLLGRRSPPRQ
jgi:uncharacterized membrane protein